MQVKVWGVEDFLRQYSNEGSRNMYNVALKQFFKVIYPDIEEDVLKTAFVRERGCVV